ncbi:MAG TPA: aminotransferase class IV [Verrucomicrobiota bacterium]|nr:aminotransferase class IV [Verrucomicrobiota bacterium]
MKIAFINGEFVPESEAKVSILDRSFQLGDGLFETIPVYKGQPFGWSEHLKRLRSGAKALEVNLPHSNSELTMIATELLHRHQATEALLRLHLSRGVGRRGYSPRGADSPTFVMTLYELPVSTPANPLRWRLGISSFRLIAGDPLGGFKTGSKLVQVLARAEVERRDCDEALLVNTDGYLVEGAGSNVFWVEGETICTPPLVLGALGGVTRAVVLQLAQKLGFAVAERKGPPSQLTTADGVFLTLSSLGLVGAVSLDNEPLRESWIVRRLQDAYRQTVAEVCGAPADSIEGGGRLKMFRPIGP